MLLDLLILFLVVVAILALIPLAAGLLMSMPLADVLNRVLRRIGLAGPAPDARAVGAHGIGTVDTVFAVRHGAPHGTGKVLIKGEIWNARCSVSLASALDAGDAVEIVYNDDLTVSVVRKAG